MKKSIFKIITIVMVFAFALSFAGCSLFETSEADSGLQPPPIIETYTNKAEFGRIQGERLDKTKGQVISEVRGSVVAISIKDGESIAYGSGVIVDMNLTDEDGNILDQDNEFYILTCHHVIDSMGAITVYLPDAECDNVGEKDYDEINYKFTGTIGPTMYNDQAVTLVGGDMRSDIALLKLKVANPTIASKITKVKFPPSEGYNMQVGEDVIAIGNPSGELPGTASLGYISYINRETEISLVGEMTLLQINVDIYHGSSGGALFNLYGELIGITNSGLDGYVAEDNSSVVSYSGLNFAIPYVVDANNGDNDSGFMNIAGQLLASKTATNYGYVTGRFSFGITVTQSNSNVVIADVTKGSVAYKAGLRSGDVIKAIEKGDSITGVPTEVTSNEQVAEIFDSLKIGDKITLKVYRSTDRQNYNITMTTQQHRFCDTGN